jgi:membrane protein required for colicin V production
MIIVLVSALISLKRGFLKEFVSLIVWIVGFWVSFQFHQALSVILTPYIVDDTVREVISYINIFLLAILMSILFNYLLSFISKIWFSWVDRLLGVIFGCARGVLLVVITVLIISFTTFVYEEWWQKSFFIPYLQNMADWLNTFIPHNIMANVVDS